MLSSLCAVDYHPIILDPALSGYVGNFRHVQVKIFNAKNNSYITVIT